MSKMFIVMKETYLRQVKSWAFLAMVFAPFFFLFIFGGIGYLIARTTEENPSDKIAFVSQTTNLEEQIKDLDDFTDKYENEDSAKKAVKKGKLAGYLTVEVVDGQVQASYRGKESLAMQTKSTLSYILEAYQMEVNLAEAKLSGDQLMAMKQTVKFNEEIDEKKEFEKAGKMIALQAMIFAFYFIVLTYASSTAQDIASEKGTKIMEVIFSSIPAPLYFYGRLLGIFAVIATHIGIYVIGALAILPTARQFDALKGFLDGAQPFIEGILSNISIISVLFILFGLFIYVALSALCGSIVTRAEDANKSIQPVIMLIVFAYLGVTALGQGADNPILKIGSYIPFISTFFMPVREINGYASGAEAWISLAILVVATIGLVYYIGRSYAGLILQTDDLGLWKSFKKGISSR